MKNHKTEEKNPKQLKRKLAVALVMLLISSILLTTTSYAWLILSVSPEVTGITMNVGANGSLEIALLNTDTRQDMTTIRSGVIGESLATGSYTANFTWGNLLDLSSDLFGMDNIILLPARIQATPNADGGYKVGSGLLSIPTYGYDGRIVDLSDDTVSAVYQNNEFAFVLGSQDYGVRAIGTSDTLSVQAAALALAKSNILTYTNSAANAAKGSLSANGDALFGIMLQKVTDPAAFYDEEDLNVLKSMVAAVKQSLGYIEDALKQGLVAVAASRLPNEDEFVLVRNRINSATSLSALLTDMAEVGEVPAEFAGWVTSLEQTRNTLNTAEIACNGLTGGQYTWENFNGALSHLMNLDYVYINDDLYNDFDKNNAMDLLGGDITLTLAPGSGIYADIADFTDDFSTIISAVGTSIEITTSTIQNPVYLVELYEGTRALEAADGGSEDGASVTLTATYGYALDLAFRCNAVASDLLLQTASRQRVYDGSGSPATLGGGSYMEFTTQDSNFSLAQMILLMDAVRVGFIDDQGNLLGVAKLNTSNRVTANGVVKAPLYLYDYSFDAFDGSMVMGERRKTDNKIMSLEQNIAKALTAVVWLDGDMVDNTMVSATEATSLNGTLNLQFASSADLVPAANEAYLNITADRTGLEATLLNAEETYNAGQGLYTTVTWGPFAAAYEHALAVMDDENASVSKIYNAALDLAKAQTALTLVSHETLAKVIATYRDMMGKTTDEAWIVLKTDDGYKGLAEFTQEQYDSAVAKIYRVDYNNNLNDEGNDVYTPIYTDESWSALAAALYAAEVVDLDANATSDEIDAAMVALDTAKAALQRRVYYIPYEYNAQLYYFAISDETDTYGKWYDNQFKRIISDKTILDLDAHAELAEIATIDQDRYVAYYANYLDYQKYISPEITIESGLFQELRGENIIAIQWEVDELYMYEGPMDSQRSALYSLIREGEALLEAGVENPTWSRWLTEDLATAEEIYDLGSYVRRNEVETMIAILQQDIDAITYEEIEVDPTVAPMTADQRTVLIAAVNAAQVIEGYDDATVTKLNALRTAVAAVQALLSEDATPTMEQADNALTALNEKLVAAGGKEVTAHNTLIHSLPVASERIDVVYAVDYAYTPLVLTGEWGVTTISAVVLTESGILFTVEIPVEIYSPAGGVSVIDPNNALDWDEESSYWYYDAEAYSNPSLYIGKTFQLGTGLHKRNKWVSEDASDYEAWEDFYWAELFDRGVNYKNDYASIWNSETEQYERVYYTVYSYPIQETIKAVTWASSDTSAATVAPDGTVTIKQVKDFTITVSVETVQGKTYTSQIEIYISVDPDTPVEDPTEPE